MQEVDSISILPTVVSSEVNSTAVRLIVMVRGNCELRCKEISGAKESHTFLM
jgi:hypothetical protein